MSSKASGTSTMGNDRNIKVRYVDLESQWEEEKDHLLPIMSEVMRSGQFILGDIVDDLERLLASYCSVEHAIALNSGTDALVCALHAAGVRAGDEVLTPPNSFVASTSSITHLGATPVFVDVCEDQMMDPKLLQKSITKKTKAVMPVHLTGRMARMDEICDIADKNGLVVIEDSAQSIGSTYKGRASGAYGLAGCFSTHPLKNLNACGDGGFITTNNIQLANEIKLMRNHGLIDRNKVEKFGFVSRMDALQAAILRYRLGKLDNVISRRRLNAERYISNLNVEGVVFPIETKEYFNTYHTFVVRAKNRDKLASWLLEKGIQTAIHYPIPIHLQPAAQKLGYYHGDFPAVERQAGEILSLPIHQYLKSDQIDCVIESISKFYRQN